MNKTVKYSLIFGASLVGTIILIKLLRKKNTPVIDSGVDVSVSNGVSLGSIPKQLNRNALLGYGSRGSEVKELQKLLGVSADGIFGKQTQDALMAKTGLLNVSLSKISQAMADFAAKKTLEAKIAGVKSTFPIGKPVVAAVTFRGYAYQSRNGEWYPTDSNGKNLPSKEFLKTADLGKVYAYGKSDPNLIILELNDTIEGFRYMGVKSSWLK